MDRKHAMLCDLAIKELDREKEERKEMEINKSGIIDAKIITSGYIAGTPEDEMTDPEKRRRLCNYITSAMAGHNMCMADLEEVVEIVREVYNNNAILINYCGHEKPLDKVI